MGVSRYSSCTSRLRNLHLLCRLSLACTAFSTQDNILGGGIHMSSFFSVLHHYTRELQRVCPNVSARLGATGNCTILIAALASPPPSLQHTTLFFFLMRNARQAQEFSVVCVFLPPPLSNHHPFFSSPSPLAAPVLYSSVSSALPLPSPIVPLYPFMTKNFFVSACVSVVSLMSSLDDISNEWIHIGCCSGEAGEKRASLILFVLTCAPLWGKTRGGCCSSGKAVSARKYHCTLNVHFSYRHTTCALVRLRRRQTNRGKSVSVVSGKTDPPGLPAWDAALRVPILGRLRHQRRAAAAAGPGACAGVGAGAAAAAAAAASASFASAAALSSIAKTYCLLQHMFL